MTATIIPSNTNIETPQIPSATISNRVKRMLGLGLHSWEGILIFSLAVAAFSAVAVGVSTWAVVRLQRDAVRDSAETLEKYKADAGLAIAKASEGAASANAIAAKANERAESARLETERLKQLVVWRSISADSRKILVTKLSATREKITLMIVANDPEAFVFGSQLTKVFEDVKWEAIPISASWGRVLPINLLLPGPENSTVKLLREAFTAAGIPFTTDAPPAPDSQIVFDEKTKTSAVVIVGSRMGPLK